MQWDGTVTFGNLLSAAIVLVGMIGAAQRFYIVIQNEIRAAKESVVALKDGLAEAKSAMDKQNADLNAIKRDMAGMAVMQQRLADGHDRMERLDQRVTFIEQNAVKR